MSLISFLNAAQGGQGLGALGQALGIDAAQTEALAGQLAPALAGGLKRRAAEPGGLGAVLGALKGEGAAGFFDAPEQAAAPEARAQGEQFLTQILGGADRAPQLAQAAAERAGVAPDAAAQFLPALAAMMQGGLQRQAPDAEIETAMAGVNQMGDPAGAGLGDLLGALGGGGGGALAGVVSAFGGSGGGLGGLLSGLGAPGARGGEAEQGGLGALLQMLDQDDDGSPLDDVLGMIMK